MGSGLKIISNPGAMTAVRNLRKNGGDLHRAVDRLSSGLRLNSAADDAAGMSMSENMRAQQRGFQQAVRNASNGVAMVQIAEAGYQSITDTLIRMRELAVEAASGAISDTERGFLNSEFSELVTEINRVASVTEHNNVKLLDGSTASLTFQIGTRNSVDGRFEVSLDAQSPSDLGVDDDVVSSQTDAQQALDAVDDALNSLHSDRASMGARVGAINIAINDLTSAITSYGQALGAIRDADIGQESGEFARQQVLQAAGVAILAQANANTGMALRLLR
jgi:flagellin